MKRFTNILVAFDGTANPGPALHRALALAKQAGKGARVTIAGLVDESKSKRWGGATTLLDIARREREQVLERLVKGTRRTGIEVSSKLLVGTPFLEVIRDVLSNGHDLVLKLAEGAGRRQARLLGSTDTRLLRKCPCPVWIIGSPKVRRFARVMAAVDADPTDTTRRKQDGAVLQLGAEVAKTDKGELHVVHAWSLFGEEILRGSSAGVSKTELARILRQTRQEHRVAAEQLMSQQRQYVDDPAIRTHLHLVKGEPAEVIATLTKKKKIDLLVMGTLGRTGVPGFIIGNTAEKVLRLVDCSILALKPEGFVSPVRARRSKRAVA